ncbi:MATE family efflux transporter [Streptomyces sp. NPDC088847]|uniref:MATE family efflux transporter n=1 Tax=Streptomyces sp. NPDC088847 TaxID=3365909 RepID=UPI00381FCC47
MATITSRSHPASAPPRGPVRQVTALGLPLLLGALSSSLSGIVDTAMMGRYGTDDLAAVSATSAVFDVFSNIVLASLIGYQILAPRFVGRQDPPGLVRSLRHSALYSGGLALSLTILSMADGRQLTGLVAGDRPGLASIGAGYLVTRAPTLLLLVPFVLLTATFNAHKQTRHAAVAGVVVNVVNLLLDWTLIYGVGPLPRLGAVGNGLATTLAWLVGLTWLLLAARRTRLARSLRGPGPVAPADFPTSIPRLAWPSIVSSGLDYASMAIFFAIMSGIGQAALAGGRIAFEVTVLAFGTAGSFAAASRILIGRALGEDDRAAARTFWRAGQYILLVPSALVGLILVVLPRWGALPFTSFPPVVDAVAETMPFVGLCLPLMAWTLGNVSLVRALGHTKWDMYANLAAAIAVQLPLGWLCAGPAGLGLAGAFVGVVGYWVTRAVFTEVVARHLVRT